MIWRELNDARQLGRVAMPRQYTPSNATEGYAFIGQWCANCARDCPSNGSKTFDECDDSESCEILAASFLGEAKEWVEHDDGRTECTAFIQFGRPVPAVDDMTLDLFADGGRDA
jgi:hypothetical protein